MADDLIRNPNLAGESFLWEGSPVGLLLIHGFTATTAEVRPLGKILHEHGYTVAGPLLPGHFTKPEDLNKVSWRDWVDTVDQAYQDLSGQCQQIVVGGESMGGLLALYLASKHPEAKAVMVYAPALRLMMNTRSRVLLYLMSPFLPYRSKRKSKNNPLWQGYPVNPLKGTIQLLHLQKVVFSRLKSIHQPILIVQGRLDPTVHPDVPEMIASQVSSEIKEIHWMEESSHVIIVEHELEKIAAITLRFLNRVFS